MAKRLYVGNLSFRMNEDDIRREFESIGQVVSCNLIMDHQTNRSRGFAFVEMESDDDASDGSVE